MRIFKKVILLTIFSIIFSATVLTQTGSALTLTPTDNFTTRLPDLGSYSTSLDIDRLPLLQPPWATDLLVSFMKFDISSLKGKAINSASLNLYGLGAGTASLFYVSDNSFVDQSVQHNIDQAELDLLMGQKLVDAYPVSFLISWHYFSSADLLSQLITSVNTPGNNYFSVALREGSTAYNAAFASNESPNGPQLDVDAYPIPEASSALLSLIGVGGIFGFNKKRGKLL